MGNVGCTSLCSSDGSKTLGRTCFVGSYVDINTLSDNCRKFYSSRPLTQSEQNKLYSALLRSQLGDVRALLRRGIDVNFPLKPVSKERNSQIYPGAEASTALSIAVEYDDVNMTRMLLGFGADPNKFLMGRFMHMDAAPLHTAVKNNSVDLVKLLLKAGAKANAISEEGLTPIMYAARCRDPEISFKIIDLLIAHGADATAITLSPLRSSARGCSVLHLACANDYLPNSCLERLVDAGANVNSLNSSNQTPLMAAINSSSVADFGWPTNEEALERTEPLFFTGRHFDHVRLLLARGADVNMRDHVGMSCVHYAAFCNNISALIALAELPQVNLDVCDCDSYTPLWRALLSHQPQAAVLLISRGCDVNHLSQVSDDDEFIVEANHESSQLNGRLPEFLYPIEYALLSRQYKLALCLLWYGSNVRVLTRQIMLYLFSQEPNARARQLFGLTALMKLISLYSRQPRKLSELCRIVIKSRVDLRNFSQLPLPVSMVKWLKLSRQTAIYGYRIERFLTDIVETVSYRTNLPLHL